MKRSRNKGKSEEDIWIVGRKKRGRKGSEGKGRGKKGEAEKDGQKRGEKK